MICRYVDIKETSPKPKKESVEKRNKRFMLYIGFENENAPETADAPDFWIWTSNLIGKTPEAIATEFEKWSDKLKNI